MLCSLSHNSLWNHHQNAEKRMKIRYRCIAKIYQNWWQNIEHFYCGTSHIRFLGIAALFEHTIAGVQHLSMWPGLLNDDDDEVCTGSILVSSAVRDRLSAERLTYSSTVGISLIGTIGTV